MIAISVILCTYNRCENLGKALESVASSRLPDSIGWEILVVDNNSKDRTKEVVEEYASRCPARFRYLFESKQGLSNARNAGIAAARGVAIAFTDDDVTVDPYWLCNLTGPILEGQCSGVGGRIVLGDFEPPSWLAISGPMSLGGPLAQFDLGDEPGRLEKPPFGACMAFHKTVFEECGGFRTDLGRSGQNLNGNEDTEFGSRLLAKRLSLLYVPSAVVYHPVPEERLSREYFLAYHFDYGRALIREKGIRGPVGIVPRSVVSFSNRILSILPRKVWRWIRETDPRKRFFNKCNAWTTAGEIAEICRRSLKSTGKEASKVDTY
jgi:glycosyltransferase involved in cell wall biosynthesis